MWCAQVFVQRPGEDGDDMSRNVLEQVRSISISSSISRSSSSSSSSLGCVLGDRMSGTWQQQRVFSARCG